MGNDLHAIREQLKLQRKELHTDLRASAAEKISQQLCKLNALNRAKRIAIYLPVNGEVDCLNSLNSEKLRKKRIFLPVLAKSHLLFAPLKTDSEMLPNRFGILEPVYKSGDLLQPRELDIVVTPLVAFDESCNRLGMGGGYYDRSFAFRKRRKKWQRPLLVGVAYDFQQVEELRPQPWDVPLDIVITEQTIYTRD